MFKTIHLSLLLILSCLAFSDRPAEGQVPLYRPTYTPKPVFSPYFNLFRNDAPLYLNYYGLVEPQMQFQDSIGQLQQGQTDIQNTLAAAASAKGLPPTGQGAGFMTHRMFFMNLGAGGAGGGLGGVRGGIQAPGGGSGGYQAPRGGSYGR